MPNVSKVSEGERQKETWIAHIDSFMCTCAVDKKTRDVVRVANIDYQRVTSALIDSGIYDTSDDFTIVRQPFMEKMKVPTTVDPFSRGVSSPSPLALVRFRPPA